MNSVCCNAFELAKRFCEADFIERDVDKAVKLLAKNISWFGTGSNEDIQGIDMARLYIKREIHENPNPYSLEYKFNKEQLADFSNNVAMLKFSISNNEITLECKMTVTTIIENGISKIATLHMSVPSKSEEKAELSPVSITKELEKQMWDKLINETIPGGMMVTYLEPGFPLCYISSKMINYLGYESESEFKKDIDGMITKCIHHDDRSHVNHEVRFQLKNSSIYSVSYRMRKKDGSYLWIQDYGRVLVESDGHKRLASIIYDISEHKRAEQKLFETVKQTKAIIDSIPGGVAIYKVSDIFETVYFSNKVPELSGYTVEEYRELIKGDAAMLTHPDDREMIVNEIRYACENDVVADLEFRKIHRDGHIVWVHLQGKKIGEEDGYPLIQCVFHNISKLKQNEEINEHLINSISGGVAVYQLIDGKVKTIRYSKSLRELSGNTAEEYDERIKDDAMNIVFYEDRPKLLKEINKAIATNDVLRCSYREIHKNLGLVGIHVNAKSCFQHRRNCSWFAYC